MKKVVDGVEIDCTQEEVAQRAQEEAQWFPKPLDFGNVDNSEKTLKTLALLMRDYCNAIQAGAYTTKTVAQLKADFKAKFDSLP